jgi:predicted AlkP superfamily pyrophosphatase or phosphodiesterase
MPLQRLNTNLSADGDLRGPSFLSPVAYDDDAASIHSRSDMESDSDDDELVSRARNSQELRAADRIMLMEEEEMDRLVTDTRKKQDRQRRGSALALPNPLNLLGRPRSSSRASSVGESVDGNDNEKRSRRRERRRTKRDRLIEDAQHGEDGELMYEMEAGGMKDGSSTGESSDRDDSDELDRHNLGMMASAKAQRGRTWWRWIFIYALIAVGFAMLVLIAWKMSKKHRHVFSTPKKHEFLSNGTALFAPTTIIISLDGFRADFLERGLTPRLSAFIKEGVSPKYMNPSFPSVTFPNHYTLATGLYPESHGVVGNTFWDPELQAEFYYTDPNRSLDPKWWGGEPFWVTAENQGIRSAIHMWPGSEAHILEVEPSFLDRFNGKEALENKVARVLEFLDKPGKEDETASVEDMRPQVIAAYVPNVDQHGHKYGPNSTEIRSTIEQVDNMLNDIFQGLEDRNLTDIVNVIVVSDHGMATTDVTRLMQLEDLIDMDKIEHIDGWPLYGLRPKNLDDLDTLYEDLVKQAADNPNFEVYLRDKDMPERYHFSKNDRIAPLWIVPKAGWAIVTKDEFNVQEGKEKGLVYHPRGLHGYDHEHPLMRAIFVARGPAFPHPPNSQIDVFQNIEVYNILCDSIGMEPKPNNGTLRLPFKTLGLHDPEDKIEEPDDPPKSTVQTSAASTPTPASEPEQSEVSSASVAPSASVVPSASIAPSATPSSDASGDKPADKEPENGNDGEGDGQGGKAIGVWDWISDKFDRIKEGASDLWDKVTGGGN